MRPIIVWRHRYCVLQHVSIGNAQSWLKWSILMFFWNSQNTYIKPIIVMITSRTADTERDELHDFPKNIFLYQNWQIHHPDCSLLGRWFAFEDAPSYSELITHNWKILNIFILVLTNLRMSDRLLSNPDRVLNCSSNIWRMAAIRCGQPKHHSDICTLYNI